MSMSVQVVSRNGNTASILGFESCQRRLGFFLPMSVHQLLVEICPVWF